MTALIYLPDNKHLTGTWELKASPAERAAVSFAFSRLIHIGPRRRHALLPNTSALDRKSGLILKQSLLTPPLVHTFFWKLSAPCTDRKQLKQHLTSLLLHLMLYKKSSKTQQHNHHQCETSCSRWLAGQWREKVLIR